MSTESTVGTASVVSTLSEYPEYPEYPEYREMHLVSPTAHRLAAGDGPRACGGYWGLPRVPARQRRSPERYRRESRRRCGRVPARMWASPGADVGLLSSDSSPPLDFLSCLRAWWVRVRGGHAGRYPHSAHTAKAAGEPHRSLPFFLASSVSARFASLPGAPHAKRESTAAVRACLCAGALEKCAPLSEWAVRLR